MPSTPLAAALIRGLYQQAGKKTWWFRYTDKSGPHRVSMKTRDVFEAAKKAKELISSLGDSIPSSRVRDILHKPPITRISQVTFVYLIQSGDLYKIGIAVNIEKRIKSLRTGTPHQLQLLHSIQYECQEDARGMELALHNHLPYRRVTGEWFSLTSYDVDFIKTLHSKSEHPPVHSDS